MIRRDSSRTRSGLTIYEVVLSIAIFAMGMIAASQLISLGSQAKSRAQLQTEAAIRAENKLAEVVSGFQTLSDVPRQSDDEEGRWFWTLSVEKSIGGIEGLNQLTVTVEHKEDGGDGYDATYTVKRLMRDPQLYIDAALEAEQNASKTQSGSNTSGAGGAGAGGSGSSGTGKTTGGSSSTGGSSTSKAAGSSKSSGSSAKSSSSSAKSSSSKVSGGKSP